AACRTVAARRCNGQSPWPPATASRADPPPRGRWGRPPTACHRGPAVGSGVAATPSHGGHMDAPAGLPVLLPLYGHPTVDPQAWRTAGRLGPDATVVARRGASGSDPDLAEAMARLWAAGLVVLGRVDVAYATRPVAELLGEVTAWAEYPAVGIFLDQVPTSPFSIGPVAVAVRAARRAGLGTVVLNPGAPPDPLYRALPARGRFPAGRRPPGARGARGPPLGGLAAGAPAGCRLRGRHRPGRGPAVRRRAVVAGAGGDRPRRWLRRGDVVRPGTAPGRCRGG